MTLIEIGPHRNAWTVFEPPGVEPLFSDREQAISYAENRDAFAQAKFAFEIRAAMSSALSVSMRPSEGCDAVIRVYDKAGNLIEKHEHGGDFKEPHNLR